MLLKTTNYMVCGLYFNKDVTKFFFFLSHWAFALWRKGYSVEEKLSLWTYLFSAWLSMEHPASTMTHSLKMSTPCLAQRGQ